jgi:8-oxo-dGTP pyrophosphatase MutT (NUDIX family)
MSAGSSRLPNRWTRDPSSKSFRLAHLRKLRDTEQVAAVCYRIGKSGIEFLLVQTRNGRWTFPKGSTEPGLTHAQAAALEAFEEAGVHGHIEETSFTRYIKKAHGARKVDLAVNAHLCKVSRLDSPQEENRNRTWFSPEQAKHSLREARCSAYGTELARVVDRAIKRIEQQHSRPRLIDDTRRVAFIDDARTIAGKTLELTRRRR